jgi:hypothetical protein
MPITTYKLEISDDKWIKFKETVSKNQMINDVIEEYIDQRIEENQ